ncbi:RING-H2 finger protein ATL57-like [Nymphaea colorata]|uniref:RING-type E3 ubiquitin transferase n=2 Tax=Nymphaea colorata TaxID=210225 RepID=A0A5K1CVI5_9MAGN|nr:RING-H2 finger protein ATL57 [Nymphaea colorata]XP_031483455.1 RING-H2 finger protein ATL57-like [Nymphaea colorata]
MRDRLLVGAIPTATIHGEPKQEPVHSPNPPPQNETKNATRPTTPNNYYDASPGFNSSMAVTILVLLTALFFMGFFSVYVRRFAEENSSEAARRRRRAAAGNRRSGASPSSSQGLDPVLVSSLPTFPYKKVSPKDDADCAVCLCEFDQGEMVKVLPVCGHLFHADCVDTWLLCRTSCPLCRATLVPPPPPPKEPQRDALDERETVVEAAAASANAASPENAGFILVVRTVESFLPPGQSESRVRRSGSGCSLSRGLEVEGTQPRRSCSF